MATIGKIGDYGRDSRGRWYPGFMTHRELVTELETATGDRRTELVKEAQARMRQSGYPSFPDHLGLVSPD